MVNKNLKRVNERTVLFAVFALLAILAIGSMFFMKPKLTGFVVGVSEVCDDNNSVNNDGCSVEGLVEAGWTCDDSVVPNLCTEIVSVCGDGVVEGEEECDDGNVVEGDGCSGVCLIEVVDTIPVITLIGEADVTIEVGSTYTDDGATAVDVIDGDLTSSIVVVNLVDTSIIDVYVITYDVSDLAENAATQVIRTVNVVEVVPDITVPIITLIGEADVTIEVGSTYTDDGATAVDVIDGDLTSSIVVVNLVDTSIIDVYVITYDVSDLAENAASQVTRTVNVVACVLDTCGSNCGDVSDGCGGTLDCGACPTDDNDDNVVCGNDDCHASEDCTSCPEDCGECPALEGESESTITGEVIETICSPNWECGGWTACAEETQTRDCTDTNVCGSEEGKPGVSQSCVMPETCSDGMKNQDEKGIDCGGVCEERCGFFTIMGNAVNVPINSSKQFIENNKVISFSILGLIVLIVAWILVAKFVLKKKNIFFFLEGILAKIKNFKVSKQNP